MGKTITLDQLIDKFKQLREELAPDQPFFKRQAQKIVNNRREDMEKGIGYDGNAFAPLAVETILQKSGHYRTRGSRKRTKRGKLTGGRRNRTPSKTPATPLMDKGHLSKAVPMANKKRGYVVPNSKRREPDITKFHEKGLGNNPVRKHWGISKKSRDDIRDDWNKWIRAAIHRVFG